MLFEFLYFVEEISETERGSDLIKKYSELYGSFPERLEECAFFDYLNNFGVISYHTPEESTNDFDWGLLLKLVSGSFSSEYWFSYENDENDPELYISVHSGENSVVKKVSELFSFQVMSLFEIYFYEQFDLQLLTKEESELSMIVFDRQEKLKEGNSKQTEALNEQIKRKHASTLDNFLN
jgi:hypothetical protein